MTENQAQVRASGRCLCGAVRFTIRGPLRPTAVACHCTSCRRFTGGLWVGTCAHREHVHIERGDTLTWFRSSPDAKRAFCGRCGSSLFWEPIDTGRVSIAAGCLDGPTGLRTVRHIFVNDKGDYYEIADGLEQLSGSMVDAPPS